MITPHLRVVRARPIPPERRFSGREHAVVRWLVMSLLLVSLGIAIAKVFKAVSARAYRPETLQLNLNLAQDARTFSASYC